MKRQLIGIDFGTANTKIYSSITEEVIFNEPSCLVQDAMTGEAREIGFLASKVVGKTPYRYVIANPVQDGMVSDTDVAEAFLRKVFAQLNLNKNFRSFGLVMAAPSKCTKVNRDALAEIGKRLQAKEIFLESQAKLAALGTGKNVYSPRATLVCNIGAGITDIACLSMGEIVSSQTSFIAGNAFDEAIRRYLIQDKHLEIGAHSAEYLKMRIGTVNPLSETQLCEIKGRDTMTHLPSSSIISSDEIRKVLIPLVNFIALKISDVISALDPELAGELATNGLILTGGSALLTGIKDYFQGVLSIPVRVCDDPSNAVINGIQTYIAKYNKQ